ncbi:hypothetical protein HOG17_01855 [Candidatus Peregrinibacteria bacterium]|jgi:hypothetical protein|nr:hypothetical protein [Candidatus Peregrinibacteria bacterium]MBT4148103.1 hypothetical protein [Candidatus Peregrinibacteria bacterium]MBT4366351.1 hypothetical protein [Candidatus Peregrinibacteria bacterium]MBT4456443.1 hypothetical protein [Candidatus Peregrinibacteria bacterium]
MNKNRKSLFVSGLIVVLVLVGLSGCGEEDPVSDSSAFLQKSVFNLFGAESLRFESDLAISQSGNGGGEVEASLNGSYSYYDSENEGIEINVVAKIEAAGENYRADVYLRETEDGAFVRLLDMPEIPNFPVALFSDLVGPWWKLESGTEESMAAGYVKGIVGTPVEDLDPLDRQKREELLVAEFFTGINFEGTETVGEYEAYRYSVELNPAGILAYQKKCAELSGEEFDSDYASGFMNLFGSINFDGDVWVDPLSGALVKIDGDAFARDVASGDEIEADIEIVVSNINKPFTVDTPLEYEVFDLAAFFGAFFESGIMGGIDEIQPMDTVETKQEELGDLGGDLEVVEPEVEPEVVEPEVVE